MVVHGVSCQRSLADPLQALEWRTGSRGMGVRCLPSANRRWGKRISSVVVFFRDEVELLSGGRETPRLKMWGRWQSVESYDFDRALSRREGEGFQYC